MKVTRDKNCFCHTCNKDFHYLGINRHRAAHRDRKEDCKITYTYGDTWTFRFSARVSHNVQIEALPASGQSLSNAGLGPAKGEK